MVRKYVQSENFPNVGQRSWSRSCAQNLWYHQKGVVIRNTHAKYESPTSEGKKVISKTESVTDGQTDRRTDRRKTDKVIPKWRSAMLAPQKVISVFWTQNLEQYPLQMQNCKSLRSFKEKSRVFVKHYSMPPAATKSKKLFLAARSKSRSQGHWPWCHLKGHH